jgi:hypothetical protein
MTHTGIKLIQLERDHQIYDCGKTIEFDIEHNSNSELTCAIMMLIANVELNRQGIKMPPDAFQDLKPKEWSNSACWKLLEKSEIDQLKIIGSFAAAEIDRLQSL